MANFQFIKLIILILLISEIKSIKRKLVDFQIYEEDDHIYKSSLLVNQLIDLNLELKLTNQTDNEEQYNGVLDMRLPIPYKANGKLIKINGQKTTYKLELNLSEQHSINLNLNHTKIGEQDHFTSDLDYKSIETKLEVKYSGSLQLNTKCPKITLHHNFTTNVPNLIYFSSNLTEECDQLNNRNEKENKMNITIDFSNLINDIFNFKLDQIFINKSKQGSELMTLINKIYEIKVFGDYRYLNKKFDDKLDDSNLDNLKYQFYKKAVFKSNLPDQFPTFQIKYTNDDENENKLKFSFELKNNLYKKSEKCNQIKTEL